MTLAAEVIPPPAAMAARNVLAIVDGEDEIGRTVVRRAIRLAQEQRGRLALVAGVRSLKWVQGLPLVVPPNLPGELVAAAQAMLLRAAAQVPEDIPVVTRLILNPVQRILPSIVRDECVDVLILRRRFSIPPHVPRRLDRTVSLEVVDRHGQWTRKDLT